MVIKQNNVWNEQNNFCSLGLWDFKLELPKIGFNDTSWDYGNIFLIVFGLWLTTVVIKYWMYLFS